MARYQCSKCSYPSNYKQSVTVHFKNAHENPKPIDENVEVANHACDQCDYKTYSERGLKHHNGLTHRKEGDFKCDQCEYTCHTQFTLKSHQQKHSNSLPCNICFKKFKYKVNVNHHLKRKHGDLKFTCELCEFKTTFKHCLQKHINSIHTQHIKQQCTICSYFTFHQGKLNHHIKNVHNHSEEKVSL